MAGICHKMDKSTAILRASPRRTSVVLGAYGIPAPGSVDSAQAVDVARALSAVAARLPWTSTCLAQALAGARLLHGKGLQAMLTLGAAKRPAAGLEGDPVLAHAWLDHGDVTVTGAAQQGRFIPVGRFVG